MRCFKEINAPSGEITSPNYPNPTPRRGYLFCSWLITAPEGQRVSLTFSDFDLEPSKDDHWNQYKLTFYTSNNFMMAASSKSNLLGKTIDSFSNKLRITYFEEVVTGVHRGFKVAFSSNKRMVCGGEVGTNASAHFSALEKNMTYYFCEWTHTRDPLASNQTTFTVIINGTFNLNSSFGVCSLYASSDDSIFVQSQVGSRLMTKALGEVCENTTEPVMVRNPFAKTYVFARKRLAFSRQNKQVLPSIANFTIRFKADPCGGIIEGPEAIITSPGYPGRYPANTDCAWSVKFQPNTKIRVTFEYIDLNPDCTIDFLRLYNGETQLQPHLTPILCGNNIPAQVITQDSFMFVEFHSGMAETSHSGFKIKLTQDSAGCGGVVHKASGAIQSPNYGSGDYPNNTECEWTVVLPEGFHANIIFSGRFSLEQSPNCDNDFIEIYELHKEKDSMIGNRICGRTPPTGIKTTLNKFRVFFRTNSAITSDGFKLSWNKMCGGVMEVTGDGNIISPNYPKPYFGDLSCNYTLLARDNNIYGKFEDFKVEESNSEGGRCRYDNVTINTFPRLPWLQQMLASAMPWRFSYAKKESVLCGGQIPDPVYSYGRLELSFNTDSYLNLRGFLFKYSVASCGGNITAPTTISNTNSTHFINCTWYITAPADKVVQVKIQNIRGLYGFCRKDGLRLYEGHNITNSSSLIEKVCSLMFKRKSRIVSVGNKMAVQSSSSAYPSFTFSAAVAFTYGVKHNCGGNIHTTEVTLPYILRAPDVDGDGKYEPWLSCDWLILAPESYQIRVKFDKMDIQNCSIGDEEPCGCDYLQIYDGDTADHENIGRYCGSALYPKVVSSRGSLLISFYSDGFTEQSGFQLSITTYPSPCGIAVRHASSQVQLLQSPKYPQLDTDSYQQCRWNIMGTQLSNGMVSMQITDLDLGSPCSLNYLLISEQRPFISDEFIEVTVGSRLQIGTSIKLCGNRTLDKSFTNRNVQVTYVTNSANIHRGFSLEYKLKGCSENYTASHGQLIAFQSLQIIDSPCRNLITAPQANATISIYFNIFACFEGGGSQKDLGKMTVYDGSSNQAEVIRSFCGYKRPLPIFSTGPSLFLEFQSHRLGRYDITYTSTDQGRGCGGAFNAVSGSFSSPFFPSPYKKDSSCRWDVSVPHGNKIYFTFLMFDLGQSHLCSTNYIQFYDVNLSTKTESLHSRHCGKDYPAEIQMSGDTAFVRYVTTTHNNGSGWMLKWTSQTL